MQAMMKRFRFRWDSLTVIISSICLLIFALIILFALLYLENWKLWVAVIIGFSGIVLPIFFCPLYAKKDGKKLMIQYPFYKRSIDLSLYEMSYFEKGYRLNGFWRVCASGGLMGYSGLWRDAEGKNYTFYLTHRREKVALLIPRNGIKKRRILINIPSDWLQ